MLAVFNMITYLRAWLVYMLTTEIPVLPYMLSNMRRHFFLQIKMLKNMLLVIYTNWIPSEVHKYQYLSLYLLVSVSASAPEFNCWSGFTYNFSSGGTTDTERVVLDEDMWSAAKSTTHIHVRERITSSKHLLTQSSLSETENTLRLQDCCPGALKNTLSPQGSMMYWLNPADSELIGSSEHQDEL